MFQRFRRLSKRNVLRRNSTKWKLYLLLALLTVTISCGGSGGEPSEVPTEQNSSKPDKTDEPVRSLPVIETSTSVLILHDSGGEWGYIGKEHAMLLENLLGHFNVSIKTQPVSLYQTGDLNRYNTAFYLGTSYDESSYYEEGTQEHGNYQQFLKDALTTSNTLVWINHNLWELAWNLPDESTTDTFINQFGFRYDGLASETFNRVSYKGIEFKKGVVRFANPSAVLDGCEQEADGQYACSPELNQINIENPAKTQIHAVTFSSVDSDVEPTPYITQSGHFWFVGDLPFLHHSIEDRYLAFADLLFDMLGHTPKSTLQPAVLRLDNIHPRSDSEKLEALLEYLSDENVPAAAAVSPLYVNNRQSEQELALNNSPIGELLARYQDKAELSILAHGLSHQWEGGDNPHSGITGDDYEFYRVSKNDDLSLNQEGSLDNADDTRERAATRLNEAERIFQQSGLYSFGWIAPEYMADEAGYLAAQNKYPVHYGRLQYFSPQGPEGRFVGQMFPYAIDRDRYNYRLIPENLGGIDPEPPTGYEVVSASQILENAKRLMVVRESIASVYFDITQPLEQLEELVEGLKEQGLHFVAPCTLGYSCRDRLTTHDWLTLKSRAYNNYLSAGEWANSNTDDVIINGLSGAIDQAWISIEHNERTMQIQSLKTGRCLVTDPSSQNGQQVSLALCNAEDHKQLWKQYGSDIRNVSIGLCLDVAADQKTVITQACDNRDSQQWQVSWERPDT